MAIPKAMEAKYNEIEPIITAFCASFLNEDYRRLCLIMLEKLCRKRPSPLLSGNAKSWAAGIVYFVCAENHYFQRGVRDRLSAPELSACFGLAASTASNRAAKIRSICGLKSFSERNWWDWMGENDDEWRLPPDSL